MHNLYKKQLQLTTSSCTECDTLTVNKDLVSLFFNVNSCVQLILQSLAKQEKVVTDRSSVLQSRHGAEEGSSLLPAESKNALFLYFLCFTVLYQCNLIVDSYGTCHRLLTDS